MNAILNFKSGAKIVIELIDTPLVHLWKDAHLKNLERNNKFTGALSCIGLSNHPLELQLTKYNDLLEQEVVLINEGIKLANEGIEGEKFPYIAFNQMPWMQVNRIHRCYTTASIRTGIWFHNLNSGQLIQCKKDQYIGRASAFDLTPTTYTVTDFKKFSDGIELINKHIHMYERYLYTQRSINFHTYLKQVLEQNPPIEKNVNYKDEVLHVYSRYTDFNWDNFDEFGGKTGVYINRTNYSDIVKSIPKDWDTYDVYINKAIAGKDYEHAYFNYDDPLEADITNVDCIDGGIRLHYDPHIISFYKYEPFINWYKEAGLEDEMVRPIPLGRINREFSSPELYNTQRDGTKLNTLGYPTLRSPFEEPIGIEFIDSLI